MKFEELYLVRLCKPEDAENDASLLAHLLHENITEQGIETPPDIQSLNDVIYSLLATGFSEFLVAEVQNEPVGCLQINYRLSAREATPYGCLDDMYVRTGEQKQEIARSMVDYACQRAEARGCAYIETRMHSDATQALKLYTHMGFDHIPQTLLHCRIPRQGRCTGHSHSHKEEQS
jgi:GNAT superfamily N-acetyltransferase